MEEAVVAKKTHLSHDDNGTSTPRYSGSETVVVIGMRKAVFWSLVCCMRCHAADPASVVQEYSEVRPSISPKRLEILAPRAGRTLRHYSGMRWIRTV